MFPLNTDGVDVKGKNALIERLNITNYDDAVVIKPSDVNKMYTNCSESILVRDCNVWFGVGMEIGSLSASEYYECVRNVTFDSITFNHPLKAIYIKINPAKPNSTFTGANPGGEITNIVYSNIEIHKPIWWAIYIGPQ